MSCRTSVIRSRSGSPAVAVWGKLSGRLVTYVRMTRPLKPDEGGTNGRLRGFTPVSLSDSRKPAEPPKPQPTRPNPARDGGPQTTLGYNPPARSFRRAIWEAIPGHGGAHK
jgi:hypothetical protein